MIINITVTVFKIDNIIWSPSFLSEFGIEETHYAQADHKFIPVYCHLCPFWFLLYRAPLKHKFMASHFLKNRAVLYFVL